MSALHPDYPTSKEVDDWCEGVLARARALNVRTQMGEAPYDFQPRVRHTGGAYVTFECVGGRKFYGFYQQSPSGRGPLLLHVPGYGAEMSAHPELVTQGYNVLHINPLGYATPGGFDELKRVGGTWPVLPDTVASLGERGYVDWLADASAAALWALEQGGVERNRYAFFGTSQGGGTALLLASIFSARGVRCVAADEPFLVNFPLLYAQKEPGAYEIVFGPLKRIVEERPNDLSRVWKAVGYIDTMSHVHRFKMPVLLTAGQQDATCPPVSIKSLFDALPGTRSYSEIAGLAHGYTTPFLHLIMAWFRLFV